MPYEGVLKTEFVENKVKPLPEKIKKIFEFLVAVIIVIILGVVAVFVIGSLAVWFLQQILEVM